MRAAITRFVSRFTVRSRATDARDELDIPFPLRVDGTGEPRTERHFSIAERTFCEGSVMIW